MYAAYRETPKPYPCYLFFLPPPLFRLGVSSSLSASSSTGGSIEDFLADWGILPSR